MRGLAYPPVSVILVPSNRDHKGNACSASARGVMIDRRVITIRGPVGYKLILLGPVGSTPLSPFHLHSFFTHPHGPPTNPDCNDTSHASTQNY